MFNQKFIPVFFVAALFLLLGLALASWQPAKPVFALTATPSPTAVSSEPHTLTVTVDCTVTDSWHLTVRGENWYHFEPVVLFANGRLQHAYDVDHDPNFEQVWTLDESLERPLTIVATTGFRRQSVTVQPCVSQETTFMPYVVQAGSTEEPSSAPDILLSPDCGEGEAVDLTVTGSRWATNEDVVLFWNGRLHGQVKAPHDGQFQQHWHVPVPHFQTPLLTISPSAGVWRIFAQPCSDPPIPTVTPYGGGPTATPCGNNCPPVATATPWATATDFPTATPIGDGPTATPCGENCPPNPTETPSPSATATSSSP